jgi:hypothetical protein
MRSSSPTALLLLASGAFALPAPMPQASPSSEPKTPAEISQIVNQPLQSAASGSLYGSEALSGYSPSNPISTESTVISPDEFELAPGQSEDAALGLYIDLTNVKNPQPIRGGNTGPTEPGPR